MEQSTLVTTAYEAPPEPLAVESVSRGEVVLAAPAGLQQPFERCFVEGRGWILLPSSSLGRAPPPPQAAVPPLTHNATLAALDERYKVAFELAHTEKTYCEAMRLVVSSLVGPLRRGGILSELELAKIFSCVEGIAEGSGELLDVLRLRLATWTDDTPVADAFLSGGGIEQLGQMYVQYVNNFEESQRVQAACEERTEFRYFIKHWQLLMGHGAQGGVSSLLIQPVQRIPRCQPLSNARSALRPHCTRPQCSASHASHTF